MVLSIMWFLKLLSSPFKLASECKNQQYVFCYFGNPSLWQYIIHHEDTVPGWCSVQLACIDNQCLHYSCCQVVLFYCTFSSLVALFCKETLSLTPFGTVTQCYSLHRKYPVSFSKKKKKSNVNILLLNIFKFTETTLNNASTISLLTSKLFEQLLLGPLDMTLLSLFNSLFPIQYQVFQGHLIFILTSVHESPISPKEVLGSLTTTELVFCLLSS